MGDIFAHEPSALVSAATGPAVVGAYGIISFELSDIRIFAGTLARDRSSYVSYREPNEASEVSISPI